MRNNLRLMATVAFACALTGACDSLKKLTEKNPTSPTATASLSDFAGTWVTARSGFPSTSCGGVTYTVTPVTASTANVTFNGTCAGTIQVNGTGSGTVSGSTLNWNAQGTVTQGSLSCPF